MIRMNGDFIGLENGVRLWAERVGQGASGVIPNGIYFLRDLTDLGDEFELIAYDPRNRGNSDRTADGAKLIGDIHQDVEDMELVRKQLGLEKLNLIGHSYMGLVVALYGMKYPERVNRIVQIGPAQPFASKQYPPELTWNDGVAPQVFAKLGELRTQAATTDPVDLCRKFSAILSVLCVADEANASKADWGRCDCENERTFMVYFTQNLMPSIQQLQITPEMFARLQCPVLTIHGRKDRNAPYGGGVDWANSLPNAQLLTVEEAAHAPWVEAPETVLSAIRTFFRSHAGA